MDILKNKYFFLLWLFSLLAIFLNFNFTLIAAFPGNPCRTSSQIDWTTVDKQVSLQKKYSALAEQYKKAEVQLKNKIAVELGQHEFSLDSERLCAKIQHQDSGPRTFLFQKWAVEHHQPELSDLTTDGVWKELFPIWCSENGLDLGVKIERLFQNLVAVCLTGQAYHLLTSELEEINTIFVEDFESEDLSGWEINGESRNVTIVSDKQIGGKSALRMSTDLRYNPCGLIKDGVNPAGKKIQIGWHAWLPEVKERCAQCKVGFEFFGIGSAWSSSEGHSEFRFYGENQTLKIPLDSQRWHSFAIEADLTEDLCTVRINGKTIWQNIKPKNIYPSSAEKNKIFFHCVNFSGQSVWIDEVKISRIF